MAQVDFNAGDASVDTLGGNANTPSALALRKASVDISGGAGTHVASAAEAACPYTILTGAITGNRVYQVPLSGFWIVNNATTGAFTVTIQGATGTGIVVATGKTAVLIGDGTNINRATPDV